MHYTIYFDLEIKDLDFSRSREIVVAVARK